MLGLGVLGHCCMWVWRCCGPCVAGLPHASALMAAAVEGAAARPATRCCSYTVAALASCCLAARAPSMHVPLRPMQHTHAALQFPSDHLCTALSTGRPPALLPVQIKAKLDELAAGSSSSRGSVVIVGAGYSGVELASVVAERVKGAADVRIITPGADIMEVAPAGQRQAAAKALAADGVQIMAEHRVGVAGVCWRGCCSCGLGMMLVICSAARAAPAARLYHAVLRALLPHHVIEALKSMHFMTPQHAALLLIPILHLPCCHMPTCLPRHVTS
jgi:hypothetical protein